MFLPQAIFFAVILDEVGVMAMGLRKLELKSESVKGQERSFSPAPLMSALGGRADSILEGRGVRYWPKADVGACLEGPEILLHAFDVPAYALYGHRLKIFEPRQILS